MRKSSRRVVSILLAALLTAGTVVMPVSAHSHWDIDEDKIPVVKSQTFEKGLKPFTSTEDLIRDTIEEIMEKGERLEAGNTVDALAEMIEKKSEFTLPEITTGIGRAFLAHNDAKRFDTSKYHLDADDMEEVLERVLGNFYLKNIVSYTLETNDEGEVVAIEYGLKDSFQIALDEINSAGAEEESERLELTISAEAEEAALDTYMEENPEIEAEAAPVMYSARARAVATVAEEGEGGEGEGGTPEEPTEPVTCEHPIKSEYVWNADYSNCEIVLTFDCDCEEKVNAEQRLQCVITKNIKSNDDASAAVTYTAEMSPTVAPAGDFEGYTGYAESDTKEVEHDHVYGAPADTDYVWTASTETSDPICTVTFTCEDDCPVKHTTERDCVVTGPEVVLNPETSLNEEIWSASCTIPLTDTVVYAPDYIVEHEHSYADDYTLARWGAYDAEKAVEYTCEVGFECELCDSSISGHTSWKECVVTREGPDADGTVTYTAKYDGEVISGEDIEAVKTVTHTCTYGTPVFTWSDDGISSCTAVITCTETDSDICNDDVTARTIEFSSENEEENVIVISTVEDSLTLEVTYVATLTFDGKEYSSTGATVKHTHVFDDENAPVFTWADDFTCTATATCIECDASVTETCTIRTSENPEENEITYTATTNVIRKSDDTPWQDSVTDVIVHEHTFEVGDTDFGWVRYYDLNDIGEDGNPQPALFYDPDYEANPEDPTLVYYDAATGIGVSVMRKIMYDCQSATVTCTECGATFSTADGAALTVADSLLGVDDPETFFGTTPMELWPEFQSEMKTATLTFTDENDITYTVSDVLNVTSERLKIHYAEMVEFNDAYPQYFGVAVPFWTSKNTEATPLDAVKTLINQAGNYVPNKDMDQAVEGLTWAFISYVMSYGQVLDMMMEEAMAILTNDMTDIQKMLVLHDWLAKNATFDMQSLIDMKSGEGGGGDPITMTAFGTLLSSQLASLSGEPNYGAVCLGYAATYALLVQQAFPKYYSKTTPDHIIDFVQIKFHANVAESSVAGADSGFGDADAIFNEPHYFNAIRLDADTHGLSDSAETPLDEDGYCWYYTDACYDDINVEVISQYRVETDGNISHMYFMNSPQSFLDMFDGNFDYFDSLHDGKEFFRKPLNNADMPMVDDNNNPIDYSGYELPAEALYPKIDFDTMNPVYEQDDEGYDIWYVKNASNEVAYADDQYEQTWFSNANSEVIYYKGNWYYVEGAANSYSALKDMFGDEEEDGSGNDFGDIDMTDEEMSQYKNDPDNADTLMVRPGGKGDRPANANANNNDQMSMNQYEDRYAEVLFHFGYGAAGDVAEDTEVTEANKADFPWYDLVQLDKIYNEQYPDLNHSLAMMYNSNSQKNSDGDGKLYFSIANRILVYDVDDDSVTQLKEYNVVNSITDGRPFEGMSFFTPETAEREGISGTEAFTVVDRPVASIMINDMVYWEDNVILDEAGNFVDYGQDGQMDTRNVVPAMYVSVGTNYSNSFAPNDEAYSVEAVNFNPDYYRFMEEDEEEEEEENDEEENTNVEFMWCANIVDIMKMDAMLTDRKEGETAPFSMNATCNSAAFTEDRTTEFGLSDGSTKVISEEETELECHYFYQDYSSNENSIDGSNIGYVCFRCNDFQEEIDKSLEHDKEITGEDVFVPEWNDDNTELVSCQHFHGVCPVTDCPQNSIHTCEVIALYEDEAAPELVTGYEATCPDCGAVQEYLVAHDHIEGENLTYVEAVAATCTATGNVEHWICQNELCGRYLVKETNEETGETAFVETTAEAVVTEMIPHAIPEEPTDAGYAATCAADGKKAYWTCETCGGYFVKETNAETGEETFAEVAAEELEAALVIELDPTAHPEELTYNEAGEPNCVSGGTTAFYNCATCQKNFEDAEGKVEITDTGVGIDPDNHAGEAVHHEEVPATCKTTGTIEYWSCSACGVNYSDAELTTVIENEEDLVIAIDPANHEAELEYAEEVAATCTVTGIKAHYNCAACNKNFNNEAGTDVLESIEIPVDADNHVNTEVRDAVKPNGEQAGYTGDTYCLDCGKKIAEGEEYNYILGDVNSDGNVNRADLILLSRYFAGNADISEINQDAADVTQDGNFNRADLIKMKKYFAGSIDSLE